METRIRSILGAQGGVTGAETIGTDADLYEAGLSSHASVNVMLALEDDFDVEFPDELLRKTTFSSISSITEALEQIGAA